ncbi:hypothetical protein Naga_101548g1, partial [Nannochloropsis gaditana]
MRPIFLHLTPVLCPIFLLAVVVSLVEAGWLGYLFGGKDATPTATLTQSPATLEACEAVLVTNMTETVQESVTDAESRLLSSSRTTFRAERTQTMRIESTEGGEAGEEGGMEGREVDARCDGHGDGEEAESGSKEGARGRRKRDEGSGRRRGREEKGACLPLTTLW